MSATSTRRWAGVVAAGAALAAATTAIGGTAAGAAAGADWTQVRGGAAHQGANTAETTITKANVARLRPTFSIYNEADPIETVVAGGLLLTVTTQDDDPSTVVRAFDAGTGAKRWVADAGICCGTVPAVLGNRVIITNGDAIWAFDLATGKRLWKVRPLSGATWTTVAAADGLIAVADTDQERPTNESYYSLVFLDPATGATRGLVDLGGDPDADGTSGPTLASAKAYLTSNDTVAWKPNGTPAADFRGAAFIGDKPALPVVAGGQLIGLGRNTLRVSNATTGFKVWETGPTAAEVDWRSPYDPAVDGQRIYAAVTTKSGKRLLIAFNRSTGARVWSRTSTATGAPAFANGIVFVAEGANGVAAYDGATGKELWRKAGLADGAPPTVARGRLYVGWRAPGSTDPARLTMFQLP